MISTYVLRGAAGTALPSSLPVPISEIDVSGEDIRTSTGIGELDRVLGGGTVLGSLVLVGGEPGIGKSTLLLQICSALCAQGKVLYVSGEESQRQLKLRAQRLGVNNNNLYVLEDIKLNHNFLCPRVCFSFVLQRHSSIWLSTYLLLHIITMIIIKK